MRILLQVIRSKVKPFTQKITPLFVLTFLFVSLPSINFSQETIIPGIYRMPDKVETKKNINKGVKSDVRIDLHRFMGFETLPTRYLSLPYDTLQHTNVPGAFTDTGFILLLLLPVLFLFLKRKIDPLVSFSFMGLCIVLLLLSIPGAFMNHHKHSNPSRSLSFLNENPREGMLGSASDFINKTALKLYTPIHDFFPTEEKSSFIYPGMLLLFLGLIFLLFRYSSNFSKAVKSFIFFLTIYFFLWWILGAGVAWYGMLAFCIPYIFLVKGMGNFSELNWKKPSLKTVKPSLLLVVCCVWTFFAFTYRASNYYPINEERAKHIYIPPFVEYQTGNLSEDRLFNMTFPNSIQIQKALNQDEESLVYLIGTQAKMFIKKNDKRVFSDTFLGYFSKIANKYKDKRKIIQVLKAYGFKYIVFDVNLSLNDLTPEKKLTRKFVNFMNSLHDNPEVELVLTDRTIRRNDTGELVSEVFPIQGNIENSGTIAIFKIK